MAHGARAPRTHEERPAHDADADKGQAGKQPRGRPLPFWQHRRHLDDAGEEQPDATADMPVRRLLHQRQGARSAGAARPARSPPGTASPATRRQPPRRPSSWRSDTKHHRHIEDVRPRQKLAERQQVHELLLCEPAPGARRGRGVPSNCKPPKADRVIREKVRNRTSALTRGPRAMQAWCRKRWSGQEVPSHTRPKQGCGARRRLVSPWGCETAIGVSPREWRAWHRLPARPPSPMAARHLIGVIVASCRSAHETRPSP